MALPGNEIVLLKLCVACGAGLKLPSPVWLAATVQVPVATPVTVLPETVQIETVRLLKVTGSPEEAIALRTDVPPTTKIGVVLKEIVWADDHRSKEAKDCPPRTRRTLPSSLRLLPPTAPTSKTTPHAT